jgi:hypothetical protein
MSSDPLNYRGPNSKYISYPDTAPSDARKRNRNQNEKGDPGDPTAPYADVPFLLSQLDILSKRTKVFYDTCIGEMQDYTLKLDASDDILMNSHRMSYPEDQTPDSISFKEYIYNFSKSQSTSSSFVNRYYENKVRGIYGTNALDIAHVVRSIYSELKRVKDFLDKYTGEMDDPSELRTIEAFQDWTQDVESLLEGYEIAFQAKGIAGIPRGELDQIDETKSREFQALFQSKLNIINASLGDLISQLYKDWDHPSDQFYNKILGPSLKFSLKVSRSITSGINRDSTPLLFQEAEMTRLGLNSQFEAALSDQRKRNKLFYNYLERILQNMIQRDTYQRYLSQLASKGRIIPNPFITQLKDEPQLISSSVDLMDDPKRVTFDVNATSDHNNLTGREDPEAHPQYVLKSGDVVSGSLEVYGDLVLNGNRLSNIFELQEDGTFAVRTSSIGWNNVRSSDLVKAGDTFRPKNLAIADQRLLADGKIEYTINFEVTEENVSSYEIEVIEL